MPSRSFSSFTDCMGSQNSPVRPLNLDDIKSRALSEGKYTISFGILILMNHTCRLLLFTLPSIKQTNNKKTQQKTTKQKQTKQKTEEKKIINCV